MVSGVHCVCKKGYYIAIISAMMETANPEKELEPAFNIMGPVLEKFFTVIFIDKFQNNLNIYNCFFKFFKKDF
jgi:RAB protein geranylgeranyltransferase component A